MNKIIKLSPAKLLFSLLLLFTVVSVSAAGNHKANATPVVGFNAGNIINDVVFINSNSMDTSYIQTFLNSKVPTCDTWGTQPSEFGGGTRRQWAEARGHMAPYTCLRDYSENSKSAAQIIKEVSVQFQINPQVLIVLLQKEQGLITDTWPVSTQYKTAAGYGCPDTAPCDTQYFGLTNQLTWAAKMFRSIMNASPGWYTPYILGNNYIQYNPNESCGGSNVTIQNRATQALYNYTPYQPNQGALDSGWGQADCGAYGNRNFYLYFTQWFGSTQQSLPTTCDSSFLGCIWRLTSPSGRTFLTASIDERNNLTTSGYTFNGIAFHSRVTNTPGSVPVYRLILNGQHFWTSDLAERDQMIGNGYSVEGVAWFTDPSTANTGYPVYRLKDSNDNRMFTTSIAEKDRLVSAGYIFEKDVFQSPSTTINVWAATSGYSNVYRLYNIAIARHFWTRDINERDTLIQNGYKYEGVGWETATNGSVPIYRMFNTITGRHFWTKDAYERSVLLNNGFRDEGIGWMTTDTSEAVYRLYNIPLARHFWTKDAYERSVLLNNGFRDEGIGWKN
jgi:hypothetical protein